MTMSAFSPPICVWIVFAATISVLTVYPPISVVPRSFAAASAGVPSGMTKVNVPFEVGVLSSAGLSQATKAKRDKVSNATTNDITIFFIYISPVYCSYYLQNKGLSACFVCLSVGFVNNQFQLRSAQTSLKVRETCQDVLSMRTLSLHCLQR